MKQQSKPTLKKPSTRLRSQTKSQSLTTRGSSKKLSQSSTKPTQQVRRNTTTTAQSDLDGIHSYEEVKLTKAINRPATSRWERFKEALTGNYS